MEEIAKNLKHQVHQQLATIKMRGSQIEKAREHLHSLQVDVDVANEKIDQLQLVIDRIGE